jgi:hypothetical protein
MASMSMAEEFMTCLAQDAILISTQFLLEKQRHTITIATQT